MARIKQAVIAAIAIPAVVSCASILGIDAAELDTSSGADAGGAGNHPKAICAEYCSKILANCTGDFEIYPDLSFCLAVCNTLPPGQRTDTRGNTVGCRLHFAQSAATIEKPFNCTAAGPGGNGICGDNCESWCTIESHICPGVYASMNDCLDACNTFPVKGTYNDSLATQMGNTFECRLYHVNAAAGIDAVFHCPHTDITLPGPCSK